MNPSLSPLSITTNIAGLDVVLEPASDGNWEFCVKTPQGVPSLILWQRFVGDDHTIENTTQDEALALLHPEVEKVARETLQFLRERQVEDARQIETIYDALEELSLERQQARIAAQRANREAVPA